MSEEKLEFAFRKHKYSKTENIYKAPGMGNECSDKAVNQDITALKTCEISKNKLIHYNKKDSPNISKPLMSGIWDDYVNKYVKLETEMKKAGIDVSILEDVIEAAGKVDLFRISRI